LRNQINSGFFILWVFGKDLPIRPSFYPHFFQDIHMGQEEIVKFVVERNEFEIRIGYWFIHSSFLPFFFLEADFAQRLVCFCEVPKAFG
jgi:hypothetical protein